MAEVRQFAGPFVITGLSGAGKTVLSRSLEDIGYLCVDNIPIQLVRSLFETTEQPERLVVVLDVRATGMSQDFPGLFHHLKARFDGLRLVFVEASHEILQRRFSIARRPHPLRDRSIERAIADEHESLIAVRELADLIVDTTNLSPHDLRRQMLSLAAGEEVEPLELVEVQSFSYLQGVPPTASLVFDVRFLPNPYFEKSLRSLPGDDPRVRAWLDTHGEVTEAIGRLTDLIGYLLPRYRHELKSQLTIAVGCTGGRHRSVSVAERIAEYLRQGGHQVELRHRDKDRWRYT